MMDPTSLVHAYHATSEVHRRYLRSLDRGSDEPAERMPSSEPSARRPRLSWLGALLAAVPGERRVVSALRHQA